MDDAISMGTEGLAESLEALSDEFADRLAALVEPSCEVSVQVVQKSVEGEDNDMGFQLSPGAIRWMVRAGALVDIDQYLWSSPN